VISDYRTHEFAIWHACERFHIIPPGCKARWDDMNAWEQASLLGYDQIRSHDEAKEKSRRGLL